MTFAAALIYWLIVAIWMTVLVTVLVSFVRNPRTFGTTRLLLCVVAIDTFRNVFENVYFGLYFGGQYGLFAPSLVTVLGQPALLVIPKLLNIAAGCVVLGLLLLRWLPTAVAEREVAEQYADHLENLAAVDELTGVYNRRHFETLARAELARFQRYLRPLSVLVFDVDHFKSINDRYGHAAGDKVLRLIAEACRSTKRPSDILARIGGEEFAVLLPETNLETACTLAERLRQEVIECAPRINNERLDLSVSIGVAEAKPNMLRIEALLQPADEALYEAKRTGRNRVCAARGAHEPSLPQAAA